MTAAGPPVVRSSTGYLFHDPACRYLRRTPRPADPTAGDWTALHAWWVGSCTPTGRWAPPPYPWAGCCAGRIATAAWHRPPPPVAAADPDTADDRWLGHLIVDLCERAAEAWAAGREDAAERMYDAACRIPGRFRDGAAPLDEEHRP